MGHWTVRILWVLRMQTIALLNALFFLLLLCYSNSVPDWELLQSLLWWKVGLVHSMHTSVISVWVSERVSEWVPWKWTELRVSPGRSTRENPAYRTENKSMSHPIIFVLLKFHNTHTHTHTHTHTPLSWTLLQLWIQLGRPIPAGKRFNVKKEIKLYGPVVKMSVCHSTHILLEQLWVHALDKMHGEHQLVRLKETQRQRHRHRQRQRNR